MYQLYQRVAPRPEDFPRLLDKIGEAMSEDFDFTEDVRGVRRRSMWRERHLGLGRHSRHHDRERIRHRPHRVHSPTTGPNTSAPAATACRSSGRKPSTYGRISAPIASAPGAAYS